MVLVRNLLFSSALFVLCCFYLPSPADAGKHHGGNSGLETLLVTGVMAKVLQKGGGGHGHGHGHGGGGRSAVMIGGHHNEPRYHGPPVIHYPAAQGYAPMMHPAPYQQQVHYPQHMMHSAPQPMAYNGQQPMAYQGQHAPAPQQTVQTTNQVSYGHYSEFQPKDKFEVISI